MISSKEELTLLRDKLRENYYRLADIYDEFRECCGFINSDMSFMCVHQNDKKIPIEKRYILYRMEKLAKTATKKHDKNEAIIELAKSIGDDEMVLEIISSQNLIDENNSLDQLDDLGEFQAIMREINESKSLDYKFGSPADFNFFRKIVNVMSTIIWMQKDTYDRVLVYIYDRYPEVESELQLDD